MIKFKLNSWDIKAIYYFILITGFVDIITITNLLGDTRFNFSFGAKLGLSIATLIIAIIIAYAALRKVEIIK